MIALPRFHRRRVEVPAYRVSQDLWKDFDPMLFITVCVLLGFGTLAIWSAVGLPPLLSVNAATKQMALGVVGLGVATVLAAFDYRYLQAIAWPLYGAGILLLIAVQSPLGVTIGGSQNWFDVGFTLIQPSEFTKVTTILALATFVDAQGDDMKSFGNFCLATAIVALPAGLILIGPDLGQTMVYIALWASTLIVMRTSRAWITLVVVSIPALVWFAWNFVLEDYQKIRFEVSYDPHKDILGQGYNIDQAHIAIGAGGLFGDGLAGGTQSTLNLLSVTESDFIFAHAAGMFGFVGMVGLMVTYVILLWRCLKVAEVSRDHFGQVVAVSVSGMLFFQSVLNIGMTIGLMPVAGITLPFVSAGISSLFSFMVLIGILQSIRMHHRKLSFQPLG